AMVRLLAPLVLESQAMRRRARQTRADAAESRTLAERQRTIARGQMAKSGDLMIALMQLRSRMALQRPLQCLSGIRGYTRDEQVRLAETRVREGKKGLH